MKHFRFDIVESTNYTARELIKNNSGIIAVSAKFQTNGHGRNNKTWLGDKNDNIYLSVAFKHINPISIEQAISFQGIGCLAVKNTLLKISSKENYKIKYPNDVMVKTEFGYRKISGVIVNNGFVGNYCDFTILGIGVNINQKIFDNELNNTAISLNQLGYDFITEEVLNILLNEIEKYSVKPYYLVFEEWKQELNIIGKKIKLINNDDDFEVIDFLSDGRLKVINNTSNITDSIDNGDSIRYDYD